MTQRIGSLVVSALDSGKITATQLADEADVSYSVIVNLKRRPGSSTSSENGERLLSAMVRLGLVQASDRSVGVTTDDDMVPVYDVQASAGFGALVDYEEQTHSLAFPPDYLKRLTSSSPKNLVIISTRGDSMEPTLLDNDIVLVDTSKTHMGYEGMFVIRHNSTLLVKRAGMASKNGQVTLISDNPAYPPISAELSDIEVVGKVLWYGRKV